MITTLIDWLVYLINSIGYVGVFLSMFIESFFAPIPSEIILPFSGFVASQGSLNLYLVILVATLGAYLGSLPFYLVGRWGENSVNTFLERYGRYLFIFKSDIEKGYSAFDKYGNILILFGRIIPIVRTVISFPAGVTKMNFTLFSLYTIVGTAIWSTILIFAGFTLGSKWEIVSGYVDRYEKVILMIIVLLGILYIARGIKQMRAK